MCLTEVRHLQTLWLWIVLKKYAYISDLNVIPSHWTLTIFRPTSKDLPMKFMMSSNGNIVRVTGALWGESVDSPHKGQWRGALMYSLTCTWTNDVFFDLRLNKQLCKQPRSRWFETPSRSLWRHSNVVFNSLSKMLPTTWNSGVASVRFTAIGKLNNDWTCDYCTT